MYLALKGKRLAITLFFFGIEFHSLDPVQVLSSVVTSHPGIGQLSYCSSGVTGSHGHIEGEIVFWVSRPNSMKNFENQELDLLLDSVLWKVRAEFGVSW